MAASRARDAGPQGPVGARALPRARARLNADTSAEPEGLTRRVMLNILEAFFRRPWLHLLPLILMLGLGAVTAFGVPSEYRSQGSINATSQDQLTQITEQNQAGFSYETPATLTARSINEQLRTETFLSLVAEKAGLTTSIEQGALLRQDIREALAASADGDNLVRVSAVSEDPQLSFDLARATLEAYRETVLASELQASQEAVTFLQQQADAAVVELQAAEAALDAFALENGGPVTEMTLSQQVQQDRLQAAVTREELRYSAALDEVDKAELAEAQAETVVQQRLRLQDEPELPTAPEPRFRKALLTVILFGVLGLILTLASVVVAATLDRTVRLPNDITGNFGLDVLAVIPDVRRR